MKKISVEVQRCSDKFYGFRGALVAHGKAYSAFIVERFFEEDVPDHYIVEYEVVDPSPAEKVYQVAKEACVGVSAVGWKGARKFLPVHFLPEEWLGCWVKRTVTPLREG